MALRKFLLIPQLIYYGVRAPRDQGKAWDRFWSAIRSTGPAGEVLWDSGDARESSDVMTQLRAHLDFTLPMVDVGCGNGRFSRLFAPHFPKVVGLDVSAHAVELAQKESPQEISFRVLDVSTPGAGKLLRDELGESNVYMRGVFHVLDPKRRAAAIENLRELCGQRGTLYLSETNITGDPLDHLVMQGATATFMPDPLKRCIAAGIAPPSHFGEKEIRDSFPGESWRLLASGPTKMYTLPLTQKEIETIPSYFAVLRGA